VPVKGEEIITKVLASGRQLVVLQRGQDLLQLEEQPFARSVAIGIHVELNGKLTSYFFHLTSYIIREQGG
jgi:hypothetical protein